jgi:hypothetical protein
VSLEEEIRIEITATPARPLSVFRRRVHACQDLISIAALTLCNLDDFRISPPSAGGRPRIGHFYGVPVFRNPAEGWPDFLFRSSDIDARMKETFTAWLASADSLSAARSLYMSGSYGKSFLELRFLALAQAAEAYHRRVHQGRDLYMEAGAYEREVLPLLKASIPATLDDAHKQALSGRLKFGNEISFRRRMTTLFEEHETALALVVPSPRSWITPIVEYRNGFTHHPVIADQQDLDKDALLRCTYVLRILLELCFLKSAGLDEAAVAALAGRCEHYRQIRSRFFVDDTGREPELT